MCVEYPLTEILQLQIADELQQNQSTNCVLATSAGGTEPSK